MQPVPPRCGTVDDAASSSECSTQGVCLCASLSANRDEVLLAASSHISSTVTPLLRTWCTVVAKSRTNALQIPGAVDTDDAVEEAVPKCCGVRSVVQGEAGAESLPADTRCDTLGCANLVSPVLSVAVLSTAELCAVLPSSVCSCRLHRVSWRQATPGIPGIPGVRTFSSCGEVQLSQARERGVWEVELPASWWAQHSSSLTLTRVA